MTQPTLSELSTSRRSPFFRVVRVGLIGGLVGLMVPTLLGFLLDLFTSSSGSWVPIPSVNLGFVIGLYVAPVTGLLALIVMAFRVVLGAEKTS